MIGIIDYGLGNLGSIQNMLKTIGEKSVITSDEKRIEQVDRIILPGVGAFDAGMEQLEQRGLIPVIQNEASNGKPILGICLGMQLLGRKSEEGKREGLGLIPFDNVRFDFSQVDETLRKQLKIPHMGWDIVEFEQNKPLLQDIKGTQRYYFVHSYHAVCDTKENVLMTCDYGYTFAAAVCKGNIYGVQFHPEKSHDFGMRIFENFVGRC